MKMLIVWYFGNFRVCSSKKAGLEKTKQSKVSHKMESASTLAEWQRMGE